METCVNVFFLLLKKNCFNKIPKAKKFSKIDLDLSNNLKSEVKNLINEVIHKPL